jgi:hypothetical protein
MPEKLPIPEFSEQEERLILGLKEKGPTDEETNKLFAEWRDAREDEVRREENLLRAQAELCLKQAKLWKAAGYDEAFLQNLIDAHYEAKQAGERDLADKIEAIFGELERNEPELYEKMITIYEGKPENLNQ